MTDDGGDHVYLGCCSAAVITHSDRKQLREERACYSSRGAGVYQGGEGVAAGAWG